MNNPVPGEELRQLLLRQLPEVRAQEIQDRLILEDGLAERLEDEEIDLLDDYARHRLSSADRLAVRQYLLRTPADRQRASIAQALARLVRAQAPARRVPLRRAFAATGGLLAAGIAVLVMLGAYFLARQNTPANPSPMIVADAGTYTIALMSSVERGTSVQQLRIPQASTSLRLQLEVEQPEAGRLYSLAISAAGSASFTLLNLPLHQSGPYSFVEALVPRQALAAGEHRIRLQAQASGNAGFSFDWTINSAAD